MRQWNRPGVGGRCTKLRIILIPPLVAEVRCLTGFEHLQSIGFPFDVINGFMHDPTHGISADHADGLLYNMAGNAFSGGCVLAVCISILLHVETLVCRCCV
jgi:hypothetical protein